MGLWTTDAAHTLRERRRLDAQDLAIFMNITPEFASPIGRRDAAETARSTVVSSLADAILVSGPMAGAGPSTSTLKGVRDAVPSDVPVLLNTGARADTIGEMLKIADGCIVGSSLKVDGHTWNPACRTCRHDHPTASADPTPQHPTSGSGGHCHGHRNGHRSSRRVARVVGIATTGMVPAVVALEASGVPLRRAIL